MLTTMRMWSIVPVGRRARVTLVKAYVWSKAWFLSNYRWMPVDLREQMWRITMAFVATGYVPKQSTVGAGMKYICDRLPFAADTMSRPVHFGGWDLWSPEAQMTAQMPKWIRSILTPEVQPGVRIAARPIGNTVHGSWQQLAWYYADRLNWHGSKRATTIADGCDRWHMGRGLVVLVEGISILSQLRKKLGISEQWVAVFAAYGKLHASATLLAPATLEEVLSMPIFGSPWVKHLGDQLLPTGFWRGLIDRGYRPTVLDLWNCAAIRPRTRDELADWVQATPTERRQLRRFSLLKLHRAMPATWWQLLRAGRQEPEEGEWVTMSAPLTETTYHAGVAITRPRGIVRLGNVVSYVPNPVGHTGVVLVATMEYDEVVRAYAPTGSLLPYQWQDEEVWSVSRAIVGPRGTVYGPTHHAFAAHPRRVQWLDNKGVMVTTLEDYTVQQGRHLLMREVNVMLPSAERLYMQIADTGAPPLTTVFDTLASQPWDPDVHDFAWQVIAGQLPTASSPVGGRRGAPWQQLCSYCGLHGHHHTDTLVHRLASCPSLDEAWDWTQRTLEWAGLAYTGTRATFWLYGGDASLLQHRVTQALRGAFFEAYAPFTRTVFTRRDADNGQLTPHICVATQREAARDWHYVSDAFSRAYDTRFLISRRPESRDEMMAAWCGLVATTDTDEVLPDMADATSETLHLSSGMLQQRPTAEVGSRAVCALLCNHFPPTAMGRTDSARDGQCDLDQSFFNMLEHGKCNTSK
jgi:hypothetical protein